MRRNYGRNPYKIRLLNPSSKTVREESNVGQVMEADKEMEAILTGASLDYSSISKNDALNIPSVATAVNFIASTIAGLPVKFYEKQADGTVKENRSDYRLKLLNSETGDLLDACQFKYAMVEDYLLEGNGYAFINKKGNVIKSINYVDTQYVSIVPSTNPILKSVIIYLNGIECRDFELMRLLKSSKDGVTGSGVLEGNPLLFKTMFNSLKYENNAISYGTKKGFLKSEYRLDNDMLNHLKVAWRKLYSTDVNSTPDVMVLNKGISFESASSTAMENQLDESKQTNSDLVYNLFELSSSLFAGNLTTGSDEVYISAIKTAVIPIVNAFNVAINKFMLLEKEKDSYFFAFDVDSLLNADVTKRYDTYDTAIKSGWLQVDEVRALENMPPLGLDFVKMSLGDVLYYPKDKKVYTTNTNALVGLGDGGVNLDTTGGKEGTDENRD